MGVREGHTGLFCFLFLTTCVQLTSLCTFYKDRFYLQPFDPELSLNPHLPSPETSLVWRSLILLHFTCSLSLSLSLLNTHSLTDKYGGNYIQTILALQSVTLSYLYGGFPAHWSPTSCALTGGSSSCPYIRHDRQKATRVS